MTGTKTPSPPDNPPQDGRPPTIGFDYDDFAHHFDDADMTDAEKAALMQALWNIICEFVALGFGVHPVQHAQKEKDTKEGCGKLKKNNTKQHITDYSMLKSKSSIIKEKEASHVDKS